MHELIAWLGGTDAVSRTVSVGLLVAARVAPVTVLAPWLTMRATPALLRAAISLALTVALTPLALPVAAPMPLDALSMTLLAGREALIGTVFAVATALPLYALDWAGQLVDIWRGAGLAQVIAAPTGERTSPLGNLQLLLGLALFATLGGHRVAIAAFAEGLRVAPIGVTAIRMGLGGTALAAARLVASALAFSIALAAPAAVSIVAVEAALGLVSRAAPQVPVFFAGMPLRAAVGLGATLVGLSVAVGQLPGAFRIAVRSASTLLHRLAQ